MTSSNGAGAFNPGVRVGEPQHAAQAARERRAADLTADVAAVQERIAAVEADLTADPQWRDMRLAALRAALKQATAEAEQARREAQEGAH